MEISEKTIEILDSIKNNSKLLKQIEQALNVGDDIKIESFIFSSKDCSNINMINGNRIIKDFNVNRISKSIKDNGYKISRPIIVNEKLEIIDGQHRFIASDKLDTRYSFTIEQDIEEGDNELSLNSLSLVQLLNNNQTNWTLKNYVDSYVALNNKDYITFDNLLKKYPEFEFNCMRVIVGTSVTDSKIIKEGKMIISDERLENSERYISKILEIRECIPPENVRYTKFISNAFVKSLLPIFNHANFNLENMKKKIEEFYKHIDITNEITIRKSLLKIYNKNLKKTSSKYISF